MPRAGLDRASVVWTAAELADAEGLEDLSLARLAERLGVRVPSFYNHITSLEGLRRELVARTGRAAIGKSADEAVLALADAIRAFAHEHPALYQAGQRAPDPADTEWATAGGELVSIVLTVLASYGLQGEDALRATRGLRSVVHGFVSLEATGAFKLALDLDESFHRLVRVFITGLRATSGEG